jgi:hypothetical protein
LLGLTLGGVLGLYCSHDYAHASETALKRLPGPMKGMDATVLRVCEAFNLNTAALPVYNCDDKLRSYEIDDDSDDDEPVFGASDANVLFGTTK